MFKKFIAKLSSSQAGFTLIELLVVIGILGILAAGLLAAIDPIEQLKKGRDTQKRNVSVELAGALTRYYAVYGSMPWGATAVGPSTLVSLSGTTIQSLIAVGELKSEFNRALTAGSGTALSLIGLATGEVYVCFDPESKSISSEATTIYSSTANPPVTSATTCTPTQVCYWCAR